MCGFIAIRQSQEGDAVVRELLLHCFALLPESTFRNATSFTDAIDSTYGLKLPVNRVQSALDRLINSGEIQRLQSGELKLAASAALRIKGHVEEASALESQVRDEWLKNSVALRSEIDATEAWQALTQVLYQMFRTHGLQTLALLDATIELSGADERSPRAIIRAVASEFSDHEQAQHAIEECIVEFLAGAGSDHLRARFLSQLADCTVSYLSLTVPPSVAERLSAGLKKLDLFLDTNVLFDLIGLGDQSLAYVAQDLARAVTEYRLPFDLRCHEATERELLSTFDGMAAGLRSTVWSPAMSAAASKAPYINSITRRYHERNAEAAISADSFLQPYEHIDVIIREKGVTLYRDRNAPPPQKVYDLQHDFEGFLRGRNRERTYEAVIHDMTVLEAVRRLRSASQSSLEARALFVTNDVMLYLFDKETSRSQTTTILPRQLLQLLRPFVPATEDFDRAFATAFAVPEFRLMNARAAAATSKMLQILATYRDFSEKTATALLANDLLLGKLQTASDEAEMRAFVESAVAEQNLSLLEERDSLAARLERLEQDRERDLHRVAESLGRDRDRERADSAGERLRLEERAQSLETSLERERQARKEAEERVVTADASLVDLKKRLGAIEEKNSESERRKVLWRFAIMNLLLGGMVSLALGSVAAWGIKSATVGWVATYRRPLLIGASLLITLVFLAYVHRTGGSVPEVAGHRLFRRFSKWHRWLYAVLITGVLVNAVSDVMKIVAAPESGVPAQESTGEAPIGSAGRLHVSVTT